MKNLSSTLLMFILLISSNINAQQLTNVSPNSALQGQTLTVSISGENTHFAQASETISIWFSQDNGGIIVPDNYQVVSDLNVAATFNFSFNNPTGAYSVNLWNSIDGQLTYSSAFNLYPNATQPQLTAIIPSSALQGETLTVTISGENTHFVQASYTNYLWLSQASSTIISPYNINTLSDNTIEAQFTIQFSDNPGFYDLNLSNNLDGSLSLPEAFEVIENIEQPEITSISPNSAMQGQTLIVTISGENTHFAQASNTNQIWFTQGSSTFIYPSELNILNNNTIEALFNFGFSEQTGFYDFNLWNYIDGSFQLSAAFEITQNAQQPAITAISPNTALQGETLTIMVGGDNTHFAQAPGVVVALVQGITVITPNTVMSISNSLIACNFTFTPEHEVGYYDVFVYNEIDGDLTLPQAFYIESNPLAPYLLEITPAYGGVGQNVQVTITAQNTHFSQSPNAVLISQTGGETVLATQVSAISNLSISATLNLPENLATGFYDVHVANAIDGNLTLTNAFFVSSQTIEVNAGVDVTVCQGESTVLTATGANLYTWSTGEIGASITVTPETTQTYYVLGVTGDGSGIDYVTVFVNPSPATPTITFNNGILTSSAETGNQWYFNGNIIEGATQQTLSITENGTYMVVVTNEYNCNSSATYQYFVGVETVSNQNFSIFPNPSKGIVKLFSKKTLNNNLNIKVINRLGMVVAQHNNLQFRSNEVKELNFNYLKSGIYVVLITYNTNTEYLKIIIE